jgi:NADH-quinone oxidoreductase subunit N
MVYIPANTYLPACKSSFVIISNLLLFNVFYLLINNEIKHEFVFNNLFVVDSSSNMIALCVTVLFIIINNIGWWYAYQIKISIFEYYIVLLIMANALILLAYANHLIMLFLLLEVQGICFYILTSSNKRSRFSIEAGLKYFILGSFSSIVLLFGITILYTFTGLLFIDDLCVGLSGLSLIEHISIKWGIYLAAIYVTLGILFKIYSAPFHFWVSDVYFGAPTAVVAYFCSIYICAMFMIFVKLYLNIFYEISFLIKIMLILFGLASIFFGIIGGIMQSRFKRLIAYSSITTTGYGLICFISDNDNAWSHGILYISVYAVNIISLFILCMHTLINRAFYITKISMFSNIYYNNVYVGLLIGFLLFSICGLPPMIGFSSKLWLFTSIIHEYNIGLVLVINSMAMISFFYYLRMIKNMFYMKQNNIIFVSQLSYFAAILISCIAICNFFFIWYPNALTALVRSLVEDLLI